MQSALTYAEARKRTVDLAGHYGTDQDKSVFVLGSFDPISKPLLEVVRSALRNRYNCTAYLEDEFELGVGLQVKCNVLADLSTFILVVITEAGKDRGWQIELGDLLGVGRRNARKLGVYYEDFDHLSAPAKDIITNNPIRHGPLVISGDQEKTVKYLTTAVVTFFFQET